ncbi:hypothetical protein GGQ08_001395 [Salinibacter ruber]|uniref:sulfotransferase family protein n=1 Tax=Salinibacter ruber TaxID=146919 RepID=UPI001ABB90E9|nr:sulfotransferase [Salinibacter ruber]MCS3650101.1 hypothetical protein [Salinibacter ruber]MCS3653355.1 hypothetical protein [Salinibacter ruber]
MMDGPIFIIGRQYSGNTMLTRCLGRNPEVYSVAAGEGTFFEHRSRLEAKPAHEQARAVISQVEGSGVEIPSEAYSKVRRHIYTDETAEESKPVEQMYARCMKWIAHQNGATRWAQKATSYIFYIDDIRECFPEARFLFLVRNPFDLAASMKRRGQWRGVPRMAYGWNKGVRLARRFSRQHPKSLSLIRYEDLVRTPRQEMKRICTFCDLSFDEACLRVPHVNRSESPYNQSSSQQGIQSSRVGYYEQTLTGSEISVVGTLIESELVKEFYNDTDVPSVSLASMTRAALLTMKGGLVASGEHLRALLQHPSHVLHRVWRRLLV